MSLSTFEVQRSKYNIAAADRHDDYWKVPAFYDLTAKEMRDMLKSRHYYTSKSSPKTELQRSLQNSELGIMSYTNVKNDELRSIICARGIKTEGVITKKRKGDRQGMIELLWEADRSRAFHKFVDLPAELRNRVYDFHFETFQQPIYAPSQPPISRVSKQLRKETLALFYATCRFKILLLLPASGRTLIMASRQHMFLRSTPASLFSNITRLQIVTAWGESSRSKRFEVEIAFTREGRGVGVKYIDILGEGRAISEDEKRRTKRRVKRVVRSMLKRAGSGRLVADDVYDLRRAMEASMRSGR